MSNENNLMDFSHNFSSPPVEWVEEVEESLEEVFSIEPDLALSTGEG